ncbi:MAG: Hsp20/alpha crystallin family protein, partial [bacterium]|nr:Hsp20/alpha crystallin family protein [bacterium]
ELALPGWQTQDVNLEMENGTLTVKGQRRMENNEAGEKPKFFIREVLQNNFVRSFKLPANLEWNKAQASFTDGMLTVTFPKNEKAQPRRIMIQ